MKVTEGWQPRTVSMWNPPGSWDLCLQETGVCVTMFGEIDESPKPESASLYRTRWLTAHNHLHDLVHKGADPQAIFDDYLRDLGNAENIASQSG